MSSHTNDVDNIVVSSPQTMLIWPSLLKISRLCVSRPSRMGLWQKILLAASREYKSKLSTHSGSWNISSKSLKFYMYQTGILFVQLSFYPFSHPVCSVVIIWTHLSSLTNLLRTSPRSKHPAGFSSWHNIPHCHKHVLGHSMFWTS